MAAPKDYLASFAELPRARTEDERRSLWRQAMATLARAAMAQQPVPLEGINPALLLEAVRTAFNQKLIDDLNWLSPPAAAAAMYELASAIPMGAERHELGRRVLERLYDGNAATFVVLATSFAAESRRALSGFAMQSRVALSLELPAGASAAVDTLALTLISRPDLCEEWVLEPSVGGLPARRTAARLLERSAREAARRYAQGDAGCVRVFQDFRVQIAWKRLLADRESLVWRHVAVARGLLAGSVPAYAQEITDNLATGLTPTEWRRAAVSLAANVAVDPNQYHDSCRKLLSEEWLRRDAGLAGTMIFGLARAGDAEPEMAEKLIEHAVSLGGLDAAEAMVEMRRDRPSRNFGHKAFEASRTWLRKLLGTGRVADDGHVALCEALLEELAPLTEAKQPTLRNRLDAALWAFAEKNAVEAHDQGKAVFEAATVKLNELERTDESDSAGRKKAFHLMRELDTALLETATLYNLLMISARGKRPLEPSVYLGEISERLSHWLLRTESEPIRVPGAVKHLTLRLKRTRTLLHLVDADGAPGEEMTEARRERRIRIARTLLKRANEDAITPLRRVICAALARACDALVHDRLYELSDVFIAAVDHVSSEHDLVTLAEASMTPEFQALMEAYTRLMRAAYSDTKPGERTRAALEALSALSQSIPWGGSLRVSALRKGLLRLSRDLGEIAAAPSLTDLSGGPEGNAIARLTSTIYALAQLTVGARRRLVETRAGDVPLCGEALRALDMAMEREIRHRLGHLETSLKEVSSSLRAELPPAVAETAVIVLARTAWLAPAEPTMRRTLLSVPAQNQEPLPLWLPPHRTIGGFYVLRSLGAGAVGSVFVVKRVEERHDPNAARFALKVPDYNADAARTLSEDEFLILFREEAGALLSLPIHPNLASFVTFDAGARPKPILVMELVEGSTVERVIERGGIDFKRVFKMLDGIGAGLLAMHERGIGHLDLKPANVILRETDGELTDGEVVPVLVDFGLAGRRIRPGCATVPYGAPEIWGLTPQGGGHPTPVAADVYAYACLTFETLTGQTLFQERDELATISAHIQHDGSPPKLTLLRKNPKLVPLCNLLTQALRREPRQRSSVEHLRQGLRELAPAFSHASWPLRA
jgi:eukaryotic-like serine/threonine-protein kinase